MLIKSSLRQATLLISVGCLSACATLFACRGSADDLLKVFGFDVVNQRLYLGKKADPGEVISFQDPAIEKMISMSLSDWTYVRDRLAACH